MWLDPDNFNDPDSSWSQEEQAYDGQLATYAIRGYGAAIGNFLEFILDKAVLSDKIRFYIGSSVTLVDLDAYYDGDWHDVFYGAPATGAWNEKTISGGPKSVSKWRIGLSGPGAPNTHRLIETQINRYEITATGNRALAMGNLRQLLAESATFQLAIGATGDDWHKLTQALARIYITAYEAIDGSYERPFIVIYQTSSDTDEAFGSEAHTLGGDLGVVFEQSIAANETALPDNAERVFMNFVEGVMNDAWNLGLTPGYFALNSWNVVEGPTQLEITAGVYCYAYKTLVNWGLKI